MNRQEITVLLGEYQVGALRAASPFDLPDRPWRVTTDTGDFVVRECFLNRRPADLAFEHRLASWLTANGFPVSEPLVTRNGETWYEIDGRLFAVYRVVRGEPFQAGNTAQARSAGAALAWFHEVAGALPGAMDRSLPESYRSPADNAAFLAASSGGRTEIASLVAVFEQLNGQLPPDLPETLAFNDFHPVNMLFVGDRFSGAFDLDCCCWGPRLLDVTKSLLAFTLTLEGQPGVPSHATFHAECGRAWLNGYRGRASLDDREIRLLPLALRREVRTNALYDLREVAEHAKRWVQHEWDFSTLQVGLVDANCRAVTENDAWP